MQPFIRSIKIYSSMLLLPTEVQVAAVKALIEKRFAVLLLFMMLVQYRGFLHDVYFDVGV